MCTNTARVVKTYKGQKGKKKKEKKNLPENNIVSIIGHQFILHTKHLCTFLCEEAIQSRSSPEAVEANSARRTDKSPQHVPILSHEKLYDNKIFPSSSIQQTSAVEELAVAVARPTTSGMRRETRKELWIRADIRIRNKSRSSESKSRKKKMGNKADLYNNRISL